MLQVHEKHPIGGQWMIAIVLGMAAGGVIAWLLDVTSGSAGVGLVAGALAGVVVGFLRWLGSSE